MKKLLIGVVIFVIILVILCSFLYEPVDVSFAEKVILKYEYGKKNINLQITDQKDVTELKNLCNGKAHVDCPSCGFGTAEIIFEGHGNRISIFPACDGCDSMRVNLTDKYFFIGEENRKKLVEILGKYGATFPCV